ncbi:hypothetical protein EUGRSUZ_H04961 [Eucalyptus grandis]|uniref:Uncharacterized protein n=3 Tax=Eucalyptus grandis TaxID=71139 RepID=A0ACC3JZ59_EUCGR|nr:hypothetical protein EUGRSUZ_H04961 [Eucalyptus grandis]
MEEEGGAALARMEGRASIDGEPKTLSFHQIKLAREAALYVVNTCTVEEALRIFTEFSPSLDLYLRSNDATPLVCSNLSLLQQHFRL